MGLMNLMLTSICSLTGYRFMLWGIGRVAENVYAIYMLYSKTEGRCVGAGSGAGVNEIPYS
jgi:hypothetical protein